MLYTEDKSIFDNYGLNPSYSNQIKQVVWRLTCPNIKK